MGINSKPVSTIRRIIVVGCLPRQFEAVRRRIGERAILEHCDSQSGLGRVMQALHTDAYAVVNARWVSHATFRHADRNRLRVCNGGDTSITRAVEELL